MRVLGVGQSCDLGDMYLRLSAAGHDVRVFTRELAEHGTMRGMLEHVADYRAELGWVRAAGEDGYVVFESAEQGAEQDGLRREGFCVIGGSELGDKLENDRAFGQGVLREAGLRNIPTHPFDDFERAAEFVRTQRRRYGFKLDGSETYALAEQVFVPNLRYRNDIGDGFLAHGRARLQRLGYLP